MKTLFLLPMVVLSVGIFTPNNQVAAQNCDQQTIAMFDGYGDGWNGAYMTIYTQYGVLVFNQTLGYGLTGSYTVTLSPGWYQVIVSGGTFPSEISWTVSNVSGQFAAGGAPYNNYIYVPYVNTGCTNSYYCNYDPDAVCDDGSCCNGGCTWINMYDEDGDGWNGGQLLLYDNQGTIVFQSSGPPNGITSTTAFFCGDYNTCYIAQLNYVDSPYYESNSAYIYTGDGPLAFDSYAAYVSNDYPQASFAPWGTCEDGCTDQAACNFTWSAAWQSETCCMDNCIVMYMYDGFGDGWNGGYATITDWNGEVVHTSSLPHLAFGSDEFCLPDGCYSMFVYGGYFPAEINWTLYNGTNNNTVLYQILYGGTGTYSFTVGTVIEGCTNPIAGNYNPAANCSDGTCSGNCQADLDNNGLINTSDLLLFMSAFGTSCN